jgi:hypothetical protein
LHHETRRRLSGSSGYWSSRCRHESATGNVPAVSTSVVDERRVTGLAHNPNPLTPALWTRRRFRLNAGRLLHSFAKWTEHVFAGVAAVVDGWWSAHAPRSVTAAFRADVRCSWWLHERLRYQETFLFRQHKYLNARGPYASDCSVSAHPCDGNVRLPLSRHTRCFTLPTVKHTPKKRLVIRYANLEPYRHVGCLSGTSGFPATLRSASPERVSLPFPQPARVR